MEITVAFSADDIAGHAEAADPILPAVERCGYGACSQCSCKGYLGNGDLCGNCHHNYTMHW